MKKLALAVSATAISAAMWGCIDIPTEGIPGSVGGNPSVGSTPVESAPVESTVSSSSMVNPEDHNPAIPVPENRNCGNLWCGHDDDLGRVETGSEDETSGYWYDYNDNGFPKNGDSRIIYPPDVEENEYGNFFGPLIETYGGIKAKINLGTGYEYAFAGIGFNLVSENQEGMDIADWQGLCLTYSSKAPFKVELAVEDEANVTEYNNYGAMVPKTSGTNVIDLPWAKFKQEHGWGLKAPMSEVLAKIAAIRFVFQTSNDDFYVTSLGKLGTCGDAIVYPVDSDEHTVKSSSSMANSPKSSSSVARSSSSKEEFVGHQSKGMYWDAAGYGAKVETGSEEESAGYWYYFDDNDFPMNGDSKIEFPADVEENVYGDFFGPLAEDYGGIKANIVIGTAYEYPYAGFGFNLVSEDMEGMDITGWKGVCLAYSSTSAFRVELVSENEADVTEYNNYVANVAKSSNGMVFIPWSRFKQETGWGKKIDQAEALKKIAAIRIKFASSSDFLLTKIASDDACNIVF